MTPENVGQLLGSLAYVRTEHAYGTILRNLDLNITGQHDELIAQLEGEVAAADDGADVNTIKERIQQLHLENDGPSKTLPNEVASWPLLASALNAIGSCLVTPSRR